MAAAHLLGHLNITGVRQTNTDWEPAHGNYEDVAREVDRLPGELELLRGGRAAYGWRLE